MKETQMNRETLVRGFFVAVAALGALIVPDLVFAGDDLNQTLTDLRTQQITSMPSLISAISYIAGFIILASGAIKLKEHGENPAQVKLAPGVARLILGAALAALPAFSGWVVDTINFGNSMPAYQQFNGVKMGP